MMIAEEVFNELMYENRRKVYMLNMGQVEFYWCNIVKLLEEVPGFYDFYTPEWAHEQIKMGLLHVWALEDGMIRGIVLTRILVFPRQKVFEVMAIAGLNSLEYLDEMDDIFERLARSAGCSTISGLLRPGLARKLRKHKAEVRAVVVFRPVNPERTQ